MVLAPITPFSERRRGEREAIFPSRATLVAVGQKDPTLYAQYQAARIVIDRPGTPAKTDGPTGDGTPVPTDGNTQPSTTHALPQAA